MLLVYLLVCVIIGFGSRLLLVLVALLVLVFLIVVGCWLLLANCLLTLVILF